MTARDDFNKQVQEYLRIAVEGKWVILAIFVIVVSVTWLYTMQQDDVFQASSSVRLKRAKDLLGAQGAQQGFEDLGWGGDRILANEILIIQSADMANRVARMLLRQAEDDSVLADGLPILRMKQRPSTPRKMARSLGIEDLLISLGMARLDTSTRVAELPVIAGRVRSQVSSEPIRGVDFIQIKVVSFSPVEAAAIANLVADAYQLRNLESARENVTTARNFLENQLDSKKDSLTMVENLVRGFQQSQGIISLDAETQNLIAQLSTFEAQREQAKISLQAAQRIRDELLAQIHKVEPTLTQQLKEGVDPQLKQLLAQKAKKEDEIQKAEFNRQYGLKNRPELEPFADKEIARLRREYQEILNQIEAAGVNLQKVGGVTGTPIEYGRELRQRLIDQEVEIEATKAKIHSLNEAIGQFSRQFEGIPSQSIAYARLERRRQSYDKLFSLLDEKYQEALINEQTTMGNVEIVDRADVPWVPIKPNRLLNLVLGILIGLGLGFALALLLRYMDTTIRSPEDVEKLGMPVLAFIPEFASSGPGADRDQTLVTITAPQSPPSESYRTMRTAIENSLTHRGPSLAILFSSPAPKEGKSTAIANFAVSAANSGKKVLLVDADLRRPVQHQIFQVDREPGLSNALVGEVPINQAIKKTLVQGLHLIPCGNIPSHPAELLGSGKMEKFVRLVNQYYDLVLFDAPPIIAMADALVLAKYTDGVVIIIAADQTKSLGLEKSRELLAANNANLAGVVVNRFNANKVYYSYYRYYYQNYYYYTTDGEKKRKVLKQKVTKVPTETTVKNEKNKGEQA